MPSSEVKPVRENEKELVYTVFERMYMDRQKKRKGKLSVHFYKLYQFHSSNFNRVEPRLATLIWKPINNSQSDIFIWHKISLYPTTHVTHIYKHSFKMKKFLKLGPWQSAKNNTSLQTGNRCYRRFYNVLNQGTLCCTKCHSQLSQLLHFRMQK